MRFLHFDRFPKVFMLLCLIFFRFTKKMRTWGPRAKMNSFGFEDGGSFNLKIINSSAQSIFFSFCTRAEYRMLRDIKDLCSIPQAMYPEISSNFKIINHTGSYASSISNKFIGFPLLQICGYKNTHYTIDLTCVNKKSLLDYRAQPCLITKVVIIVVSFGLLVVWVVNWIINRKVENALHLHYSLGAFFTLFYFVSHYCVIRHFSRSDRKTIFRLFYLIFYILHQIYLLSTILMIAHGMCLIKFSLPAFEKLSCVLWSIMITIPPAFTTCSNSLLVVNRQILSLFIGLRLFFIMKFVQSYNNSVDFFFEEHRYIEKDELSSVYQEFKRFRRLFKRIFIYILSLETLWVIDDFKLTCYWISQFIQDIFILVIQTECGWTCRLQSVAVVIEGNTNKKNEIKWEKMKLEEL